MKSYFLKLYQYNKWANELFSEALSNNSFENQKILVLLNHIANAQLIWLNRILPMSGEVPGVWQKIPLDQAIDLLNTSNTEWLLYLNGNLDFEEMINYVDTIGQAHQTKLEEIVTHVANHGTHHRAQLATLLRQENIAPPPSDYIFFCRAQSDLS